MRFYLGVVRLASGMAAARVTAARVSATAGMAPATTMIAAAPAIAGSIGIAALIPAGALPAVGIPAIFAAIQNIGAGNGSGDTNRCCAGRGRAENIEGSLSLGGRSDREQARHHGT